MILEGFSNLKDPLVLSCLRVAHKLGNTEKGGQSSALCTCASGELLVMCVSHRSAWLSLSCALALLLVLSVLGNVGLVLRGRQQHRKQDYCYHPLRDINGDTPHCPTSAAWDQEEIQQLEDTQEPNQEFL